MGPFEIEPIGFVESPYGEKFGIPRQSGLVPEASGRIRFCPPYDEPAAFEGLESASHLWLLWLFHAIEPQPWRPRVRPPRLGGNQRLGVFATRSGFRPNRLGLSVVRLEQVLMEQGRVVLEVSGLDLLDGTPILDIKPYLPYVDAIPDAYNQLAPQAPGPELAVEFAPEAALLLQGLEEGERIQRLIARTLALDPRPAYRGEGDERSYGMRLAGYEVRWRLSTSGVALVESVQPI